MKPAHDLNQNRRSFLADCGMGFTGLALSSLLKTDGVVHAPLQRAKTSVRHISLPKPKV